METPPKKDKKDEGELLFFGSGLAKPAPKQEPAPEKTPPLTPPSAEPEKEKEAAASPFKDKLKKTFSFTPKKKKDDKEKLKDTLQEVLAKDSGPAKLQKWNKSQFSRAPISAEQRREKKNAEKASGGIMGLVRRRPIWTTTLAITGFAILAADMLIIMRKYNIRSWNPIGPKEDILSPAAHWETRGSALSLVERGNLGDGEEGGGLPSNTLMASAVQGSNQLASHLIAPRAPEGLGGILNPDETEDREKLKKVSGIEINSKGFMLDGKASGMDRTKFTQEDKDAITPVGRGVGGGIDAGRGIGGGAEIGGGGKSGVYFGDAGNHLDNFAEVNNPVAKAVGFVGIQESKKTPKDTRDLQGEELGRALIDESIIEELKQFEKEATWRMRKRAPGEKTASPLPKDGLANSAAWHQLGITTNIVEEAFSCPTCSVEDRVGKDRAAFHGESFYKKE